LRWATADAQEVGDPEALYGIGLGLAQPDLPVGLDLEQVEDRYPLAAGHQGFVEGQPVVAGGLQRQLPRGERGQLRVQGNNASLRVGKWPMRSTKRKPVNTTLPASSRTVTS